MLVVLSADTKPFANAELSSGYMQLAEGKCGGEMKAEHEAKCGENKKAEGKCGATKIDKAFMATNPSYSNAIGK
jgi:uncharacterized low-complexity protein